MTTACRIPFRFYNPLLVLSSSLRANRKKVPRLNKIRESVREYFTSIFILFFLSVSVERKREEKHRLSFLRAIFACTNIYLLFSSTRLLRSLSFFIVVTRPRASVYVCVRSSNRQCAWILIFFFRFRGKERTWTLYSMRENETIIMRQRYIYIHNAVGGNEKRLPVFVEDNFQDNFFYFRCSKSEIILRSKFNFG